MRGKPFCDCTVSPQLVFKLNHENITRGIQRTRGALTGASSASLCARIIVEDSLCIARSSFRDVFEICVEGDEGTRYVDALSWSDNLAVCANSLEAAQENLGQWNNVLRSEYGCELKLDSLQAVPARCKALGSQNVHQGGAVWEVLDEVKCLGDWVFGVGNDRTDLSALMNAWTRAFWANGRLWINSRASSAFKFRAV